MDNPLPGVNKNEIKRLKHLEDSLHESVHDHERKIRSRAAEFRQLLPLTKAEQMEIDKQKRSQFLDILSNEIYEKKESTFTKLWSDIRKKRFQI